MGVKNAEVIKILCNILHSFRSYLVASKSPMTHLGMLRRRKVSTIIDIILIVIKIILMMMTIQVVILIMMVMVITMLIKRKVRTMNDIILH